MSEKSPETRHAEHSLMLDEFKSMQKWREDLTESITGTLAKHSDILNESKIDTLKQLSLIERGIAEKMSTDSALMFRQSKIEEAFDKLGDRHSELMKATERLAVNAEQQSKQIHDAHEGIRGVRRSVEKLEQRAGNLAIKILLGAGGVAGTAAITYLVTSALQRGGTP